MKKIGLLLWVFFAVSTVTWAQSTYEEIDKQGKTTQQEGSVNASDLESTQNLTEEEKTYQASFLKDLQETGAKINENAETWTQETAKRGYPKKKTVKEKAQLVDHYIFLLSTQLSDSRLNRFIDKQKVQDKITYWQNYRQNLEKLL